MSNYRYFKSSMEGVASEEYEILKTLNDDVTNKLYSSYPTICKVLSMSIEWLLTKNAGTDEIQGKTQKSDKKEAELSGTVDGSKPEAQQKATEYDDKEKERRAAYFSSAQMQNQHTGINLSCRCGYTGTVTQGKTDFKLLHTDKKDFAFFECPNCRRRLRYNSSTGEIKISKGLLGIFLGRFG